MNLLHSVPEWLPLTQSWLYGQILSLQETDLGVHVACTRKAATQAYPLENVHSLSDEHPFRALADKAVRKLGIRTHLDHLVRVGQRISADLVHSHFGDNGWRDLSAVSKLQLPHVVSFYGYDVHQVPNQHPKWRLRYRELFGAVDAVLCEGSFMAASLAALGCPEDKLRIHHLGVDTCSIRHETRRRGSREPLKVLIAASFREKKGIPDALRALASLRGELDLQVTIIGDSGKDPHGMAEKAVILGLLKESGLDGCTTMLGYRSREEMIQVMYRNHVFLHPSVTALDGDCEGGAPVAIIEAMATGMPVVSTAHCDIPEVLGPELVHLTAPERSPEVLRQILSELARQPETWAHIGLAARHRIETEYDLHGSARRLEGIYRSLHPERR